MYIYICIFTVLHFLHIFLPFEHNKHWYIYLKNLLSIDLDLAYVPFGISIPRQFFIARMFYTVFPFWLVRSMIYSSTARPRSSVRFTDLRNSVPCLWRRYAHTAYNLHKDARWLLPRFVEFSNQLPSFWNPSLQITGAFVVQNSNFYFLSSGRLLFCVWASLLILESDP